MDLISVLLPVYNGENTIEDSVLSILNQRRVNLECIIIDDCSTDSTQGIIRRLKDQDDRIRYFKNDVNRGLAYSLNRAIVEARGDFFARQDADDCSHPMRLYVQLNILKSQKDISLIFSNSIRLTDGFKSIPNEFNVDVLNGKLGSNSFVHGSMFCSSQLKNEIAYNESIRFGQDFALWKSLEEKNRTLAIIRFPLYQYSYDSISVYKFIYQAKNAFMIQNQRTISNILFSKHLIHVTKILIKIHIKLNNTNSIMLRLLSKFFWPYYYLFFSRNNWKKRVCYLPDSLK